MDDTPTLFWKFSTWIGEVFPEITIPLIIIGGAALIVLIRMGVRYSREVRNRSPFETL